MPTHTIVPLVFAAVTAFSAPYAFAAHQFASFSRASEPVLNDPHDLEIGPDGRLYVANKFAGEIVVMDPETLEIVETFGAGQLPGVHDISFGPDGKAYIAVTGASAVAIFDFSSGTAQYEKSYGGISNTEGVLAHSNGGIYAMASGAGTLIAIRDGIVAAVASGMPGAHDVAEAPDGTIWVADNFNRRLRQFDADLNHLRDLDGPQYGFVGPRYLAVDEFGRLVVADQDAHRILLIDPFTDELVGLLGDGMPGLGPNKFDDPEGAEVVGNTYYFSDSDNNRVVKYEVITH